MPGSQNQTDNEIAKADAVTQTRNRERLLRSQASARKANANTSQKKWSKQ